MTVLISLDFIGEENSNKTKNKKALYSHKHRTCVIYRIYMRCRPPYTDFGPVPNFKNMMLLYGDGFTRIIE